MKSADQRIFTTAEKSAWQRAVLDVNPWDQPSAQGDQLTKEVHSCQEGRREQPWEFPGWETGRKILVTARPNLTIAREVQWVPSAAWVVCVNGPAIQRVGIHFQAKAGHVHRDKCSQAPRCDFQILELDTLLNE